MRNEWWQEERGFSLLELVTALPITAMLLVSLAAAFLWLVRLYVFTLSDWELQAQVRMPLERMVLEASTAGKIDGAEDALRMELHDSFGKILAVQYGIKGSGEHRILTRRDDDGYMQPLTGGSMLGDICIREFSCVMLSERLAFLRITGENRLTGHQFSLETAVAVPGNGGASDGT